MKVLQINSVSGIGSTGRITADIHSVLEKNNYDSRVAFGRGKVKNASYEVKIGGDLNNYLHVAKSRIIDRHGFGSKKATQQLIREIKVYQPDVIHLHNLHGYYINIEILFNFLKEFNRPIVWTLHDCWAFTGHCAHFDYIGCEKWKTECFNCPQKKSYPKSEYIDNSKKNYYDKKKIFTDVKNLTIVTPSKWLQKLVELSYLQSYNTLVINNGINLDLFKPIKSDFRKKFKIDGKFILLGVANDWNDKKGYSDLVSLSTQLPSNTVLVMVGVSKKQAEELPNNIIAILKTNSTKELVEIYSAANIFLNPTYEDNFPTTNLEAMACGTPVITYNTGGSIESIDSSTGLIVKKGSRSEMLEAIEKIRENSKEFYTPSCLKKASKLYNKNDRFVEYMNLYKRVLE